VKKWGSNMCGGLYDLNDLLKLLTITLPGRVGLRIPAVRRPKPVT